MRGNRFLSSIFWTFFQQFGVQVVNFVVQVLIANQIGPGAVGAIAILNVFIVVANDLVDGGMASSLIRSAKPDQRDYSTVFFTNLGVSLIIYLVLFFASPFVATFYNLPQLKDILRVYGLCVIVQSFLVIQRTKLTKELKFKTQAFISIPSTIGGGLIGLILAFNGWGVWSLVVLAIAKLVVEVVLYNVLVKWTPIFYFNKKRLYYHFNYGYKLTLSGILNNVFNNIYSLVVGKYIGLTTLGLYDKSIQLRQILLQNISMSLNKVTFPLFAEIQNDNARLKEMYRNLMILVFAFTSFLLLNLNLNAENIFKLVFTEEWYPGVPYFKLICIAGLLFPLHSYNLNILKVKGKSGLFLKLEFYKKILTLINIVVGIQFGIYGLLYGMMVTTLLAFFINTLYSGKEIDYSAWSQIKDIAPVAALVTVSYFLTLIFKEFILNKSSHSTIVDFACILFVNTVFFSIGTYLTQRKRISILLKQFKR